MSDYYSKKLNSNRLQLCYQVAPDRVKHSLEKEIGFVLDRISEKDTILDLGCGYGRVATRLSEKANRVVGIDISLENIKSAKNYNQKKSIEYLVMDASDLQFADNYFDVAICIQNGISAFKIDPKILINEAIRVTRQSGIVLFSSYSDLFWKDRLEWFQIQAAEGLIGEIDYRYTQKGIIVCKDGFRSTTFTKKDFLDLSSQLNAQIDIYEIDDSIVFCEIRKK